MAFCNYSSEDSKFVPTRQSIRRATAQGLILVSYRNNRTRVFVGFLAVREVFVGFHKGKGKAIPVTGCETSRLPHFLDNRLTYGGAVVSLTCRPPFYTQEDFWYSFLLETESTPGP
jgi:hypothetical protein